MANPPDNSGKPPGPPRPPTSAPGQPRPGVPGAMSQRPSAPQGPPPQLGGAPGARPAAPGVAPKITVPSAAPIAPPAPGPAAPVAPPTMAPRPPPPGPAPRPPPAAARAPAIAPPAPAIGPPAIAPPAAAARPPTAAAPAGRPPIVAGPGAAVPPRPAAPAPAPAAAAGPAAQSPIPASGPIDEITPPQAAALAAMALETDNLDYFQVLKLPNTATPGEIKAAFYRESRIYHPDRFFHLTDEKTKEDLGTLYKRITEAYYFLRDDQKRRKYVADIQGPDRKNKLRFTETSEAEAKVEAKKAVEEQIGTHPKGREFYKAAQKEMAAQKWAEAMRSLKSALMYEPKNAKYKEDADKVQLELDKLFKAKGDQFKIR